MGNEGVLGGQEKYTELNNWVVEMGVPGLSIGDPASTVVPRGEKGAGVYLNGEHKKDIYTVWGSWGKKTLQDAVTEIMQGGPAGSEAAPRVKIVRDSSTVEIMRNTSIDLRGDMLTDAAGNEIDLYNGGENVRIDFKAEGNNIIIEITEKTGDKIQYKFINGSFDPNSRTVL